MKVLQINTVCGQGSVGRITVDLYRVLKEKQEHAWILYGRNKAPDGVDAIRLNPWWDMGVHVLKTFVQGRHGFGSVKATKKIIEKIKKLDPDVIHLHNIHGFYLNIELLFAYLKTAGKAVVWTLHDCWSFTGHCAYFDYAGCEKWKTGCYLCEQYRSSYPYAIWKDNSIENYARKKEIFNGMPNLTMVTPSYWLKDLVKQSFLKNYPVKVIPNGIDLTQFTPTKGDYTKQFQSEKQLILGVANVWERRKGLSYFIQLAKNGNDSVQIILVGLSKKQMRALPKNMIGITRTNHVKELAELYTLADCYVNVSLEDNFPTTNLEALACGTPVITFDTGGSKESLTKDCGIVVEKGNVRRLQEAIEKVGRKAVGREMFSKEQCIEQAKQFEKKKRFDQYVGLYRTILNRV